MSVRERMLATVVLGVIVLAGAVLMIQQFIWRPLRSRDDRISALKSEIDEKRTKIAQIEAQKPKFEVWRRLSLPADLNFARLEYEKLLRELLRQSGFERQAAIPERNSPTVIPKPADTKTGPALPGKKEPVYTRLTFSVVAHGELADLVDFLERFYRTPLLHEIKKLDIRRPLTPLAGAGPQQRTNDLDIDMTIEVLALTGADKRDRLLPSMDWKLAAVDVVTNLCNGPTGLMVVPWAVGPTGPLGPGILASSSRQYGSIAAKDIFFGPKEVDQVAEQATDKFETLEFVVLTDITHTGSKTEAFLNTKFNKDSKTRLRASAGFDSFRIRNSKDQILAQGKVVRIDKRDLIFRSGDTYYSIHVGENLGEALKRPLNPSQLKELGLNGTTSNSSTSNGSGK